MSIETYAAIIGGDDYIINIRLFIREVPSGVGIRSVRVTDNHDFVMTEVPITGCPNEIVPPLDLGPVERTRLPLNVIVTDCANVPWVATGLGSTLYNPGGQTSGPILDCNPLFMRNGPSQVCLDAQRDAQNLRNLLVQQCNELNALRGNHARLLGMSLAMYASFVAFTITAAAVSGIPAFGPAIAAGLLAAAAGLLIASLIILGQAAHARDLVRTQETAYNSTSQQFRDAADRVRRSCCPGAITVSLDHPPCG